MDERIKKWIKALRSGRYKQGQETLYNKVDKTYCCLGVYARVNKMKGHRNMGRFVDEDEPEGPVHIYGSFRSLSSKEFPDIYELIDLNDVEGKTFEEIADYIEDYFKDISSE